MKKHLIHLGYIVLVVTAYLTAQSQGTTPSVTLTVEGGGSLVGEQCPGAVKISCNGINLSILRWRFNGDTDIITFFSVNVAPSPFTNNPAFLSVKLLSTEPDPLDPNFANFSSELVVDMSKLETESVTSITCGDPDTFKVIAVDVEIIQQTDPESPNGTNVTALYEDGSLTNVIVFWEKLETRCPVFQSSLVYQVTLLGSSVAAVNHTSCGEVCVVNFQNFSSATADQYRVSLYAINVIGTSEFVEYPATIVRQSSAYFTPVSLSRDCLFIYECLSNGSIDTDSCNVLYTTDSMYRDSTMIVSPFNKQFEIAEITSNTIYYFEFSVSVNVTLLVRNRLTAEAISSPRFSAVVIVFLALTILLITVGAAFAIVICVAKQLQGVKAKIVWFMVCLLGVLGLIFLIAFSIITGVQQDTCSLIWSRTRDALIISAFLFAILGNFFLVGILLVSRQDKKSVRINLSYSKTASCYQISIKSTEFDSSSVQMNTTAEGSTSNSEGKKNTASEASNAHSGEVHDVGGELESSQNKFTVYKVVVTLEDRSYLVFRRYSEFENLFDEIKKAYPSMNKLVKLPGEKPLNNKFNPKFIKKRRVGLRDFIINLMKISNIIEFSPVREFLAIDDPRSALPINDPRSALPINDPRSALPINDQPADERRVKEEDIIAEITDHDLDLLKVIGKGTFVKVYLGRHKENGAFYAIKVLQKEAITINRSEVELIMARRSRAIHPFLVGLQRTFQTTTDRYFLLDYVSGGKLSSYLQRQTNSVFDEDSARFYAAEITSALRCLHSHNIIYWDLKIENILLDTNGHIMLTDLGLCKEEVKFGETVTTSGTPKYPAPEVIRNQKYDYSVDWWCLGVVTYQMMCGLPPFYSEDVTERHNNIILLKLHTHITTSSACLNLLEGLLQKDKDVRLGDKHIEAHSFFKSINWDALFDKQLMPPFKPPVKDVLKLGHFGTELTAKAISGAQKHKTVSVPCVSIANNTFNIMN